MYCYSTRDSYVIPKKKKTKFTAPDTTFITDEDGAFYTGFTYVPAASKAMWDAGLLERTPSETDGAHSEGDCGGTFKSTVTYDANRNLVALVVDHSIFNEDEIRWTAHYRKLHDEYPGIDHPSHGNISDQDKGLEAGRKKGCALMSGFHCYKHRWPHVGQHAGAKAMKEYMEAVYAYSERHLNFILAQMNAATKTYIDKIPHAEQFKRSAFLAGVSLRNYSTQQGAESFNGKLISRNVRHVPVLDAMANIVSMLRDDIVSAYNQALTCSDHAPPRIRTMLRTGGEDEKLIEKFSCKWQGTSARTSASRTIAHVWHVDYPDKYFVVNIKEGTCSCCRPEVIEAPCCVHLATCANSSGVDLAPKLQAMDTTARWREQTAKAYSVISSIIPPSTAELDFVAHTPLQPPVAGPRPRGRPPKADRKESAVELALGKNQCAICKQFGHKTGSRKCPRFNLTAHELDLTANAAPTPS